MTFISRQHLPTRDLPASAATTSFAVAATVSHGAGGLVAGACVTIALTLVIGVLRELFWLRALDRIERHQRWLLGNGMNVDDVLRLIHPVQVASRSIVFARAGRAPAEVI